MLVFESALWRSAFESLGTTERDTEKWRIEMKKSLMELSTGEENVSNVLTHLKNGKIEEAVADFAEEFRFNDRGLGLEFTDRERLREFFLKQRELYPPRGSVQKRPSGVISKPANGSGPELLEVVLDRELSKQGKSGFFPQSFKKNAFRSLQPRFLEVAHGSGHGFSGAEGSVCDLVLQLRGPHLRM